MPLPESESRDLNERGIEFIVTEDATGLSVVFPAFQLPAGFTVVTSTLLIRLSPGYPDVAPDMWWFAPFIMRPDGVTIRATEARETYLGQTWQRWSRHFEAGQWLAGRDSILSYLALIRQELCRSTTAGGC